MKSENFHSKKKDLCTNLNDDIESDMKVSTMDKHVRNKPPYFFLCVGIKYQRTLKDLL